MAHYCPFQYSNELTQDFSDIMRLFTLRLNSQLRALPPPSEVEILGRRIAEKHTGKAIDATTKKLVDRLINRAAQKMRLLQEVKGEGGSQPLKSIGATLAAITSQYSIEEIIYKILGIQGRAHPLADKVINELRHSQQFTNKKDIEEKMDRRLTGNSRDMCSHFRDIYGILEVNETEFARRMQRASEQIDRNSKYLFSEILERNSHTAAQIKAYQAEYQQRLSVKMLRRFQRSHLPSRNTRQFFQSYSEYLEGESIETKIQKLAAPQQRKLKTTASDTREGFVKLKSTSAASFTEDKINMENKKRMRALISKASSGCVLQMSKVHFMEASEVPGKVKLNLKSGMGQNVQNKIRFKQEFYVKRAKLESILGGMKSSHLKNSSSLPAVDPNFVMVSKGFKNNCILIASSSKQAHAQWEPFPHFPQFNATDGLQPPQLHLLAQMRLQNRNGASWFEEVLVHIEVGGQDDQVSWGASVRVEDWREQLGVRAGVRLIEKKCCVKLANSDYVIRRGGTGVLAHPELAHFVDFDFVSLRNPFNLIAFDHYVDFPCFNVLLLLFQAHHLNVPGFHSVSLIANPVQPMQEPVIGIKLWFHIPQRIIATRLFLEVLSVQVSASLHLLHHGITATLHNINESEHDEGQVATKYKSKPKPSQSFGGR